VVADPIVPADVGVVDDGWQSYAAPLPTGAADLAAVLGARRGPVLTVSTITSTDEQAATLLARFPGALAEAMEGYGCACAAAAFDIPCHELRAVSNAVGLRDRPSWEVASALGALTGAMPKLIEELEQR
jgi:futalosine hydrolase